MSKQSSSSSSSAKLSSPSSPVSIVDYRLLASLSNDLLKIYTEQTAADLILQVQERRFPAHSLILCARSPVFKAMLESDMSEKQKKTISISDLDEDTVDRLLRCLYTGVIEDLQWDSVLKLYYAGDKYQIVALKDRCRTFIQSCLSTSNVCEALILTDMHVDEDLKKTAQDFIYNNKVEVLYSDQWMSFMEKRSSMAAKTLQLVWERDHAKAINDAQLAQLAEQKRILAENLRPYVHEERRYFPQVQKVMKILHSEDLNFLQRMTDEPKFRSDKITEIYNWR